MQITLTPVPNGQFIAARYDGGVFTVNGEPRDIIDGMVIEYDERLKCSTMSTDPTVQIVVIPSTWVDPTPPPKPDHEAEALAALEAWRNSTVADAWQIISVLGPERWQTIVDWAKFDFVTTVLVEKATTIPRASQTVDVMAYVLDLTPEETDEVFRVAMGMRA